MMKTKEEIYMKHTGDSFGRMKQNAINNAMEEYASQYKELNAELLEALKELHLLSRYQLSHDDNREWDTALKPFELFDKVEKAITKAEQSNLV